VLYRICPVTATPTESLCAVVPTGIWIEFVLLNITLFENVDTPTTDSWSSTITVPALESSVRFPEEVSISLSSAIPILTLSIVAPPFASMRPLNVDIPAT